MGTVQANELVVLHPGDEVPNDIRVRIAEKKTPAAAPGIPEKASR